MQPVLPPVAGGPRAGSAGPAGTHLHDQVDGIGHLLQGIEGTVRRGGERALPPTPRPSGEAVSAPVGPGHSVPVDAHDAPPGYRQERPASVDASRLAGRARAPGLSQLARGRQTRHLRATWAPLSCSGRGLLHVGLRDRAAAGQNSHLLSLGKGLRAQESCQAVCGPASQPRPSLPRSLPMPGSDRAPSFRQDSACCSESARSRLGGHPRSGTQAPEKGHARLWKLLGSQLRNQRHRQASFQLGPQPPMASGCRQHPQPSPLL